MEIIVRGRHTGVAQRFRDYAEEKLAKIEKLDPKAIRIDVEVSKERNPRLSDRRERVELTCRTRGPTIRAEAAADDRFAAFEKALDRLKERTRKVSDRRKVHRGAHTPQSVAEASVNGVDADVALKSRRTRSRTDSSGAAGAAARNPTTATGGESAVPDEYSAAAADMNTLTGDDVDQTEVPLETHGDTPVVVREKIHRAKPMTLDQALFEMELVGHDFFLFRDRDSQLPSVVYRRRGFDYGVLRLEE